MHPSHPPWAWESRGLHRRAAPEGGPLLAHRLLSWAPVPRPFEGDGVKTYRLAPDGPFWRLTRSGIPEMMPQLFESRSKAIDAAILLAELSIPCRLVVYDQAGVVDADLGFGVGTEGVPQ